MLQGYSNNLKHMLRECATYLKRYRHHFKILIIFLSFAVPFALLYHLDAQSFEKTWKGRTFYLFFIWLVSLEIILNWGKFSASKLKKLGSVKTVLFIVALLLPTIYVVISNYCGLNAVIVDVTKQNSVPFAELMPLSTEYLVFAVFFALIILPAYGINGLMDFSLSLSLLGAIGAIYTIDNLYPFGSFTPFQIFVQPTATLSGLFLHWMGYTMSFVGYFRGTPVFVVSDALGRSSGHLGIGWPCSGVESLLIYTFTILLFLKKTAIPWKQKIIYFVIGAVVTYFINVLRIVTIFVIAINGGDIEPFHDYYGPLYSITWIVSYLLIIIGSRILWGKIMSRRTMAQETSTVDSIKA